MATTASFYIENDDGTFSVSFLLYDGFPSMVIPWLIESYSSAAGLQTLKSVSDFEKIGYPTQSAVAGTTKLSNLQSVPKWCDDVDYMYMHFSGRWFMYVSHNQWMAVSLPIHGR
jgi:hypothetical protein